MQNVEIVVSQEILAALRLLGWQTEEAAEGEKEACRRELRLETPAVSLEVALWMGRSAPIQWRLTAPRVDRPGWETLRLCSGQALVGHLVAASEYCVEDVTIIYEDERGTALLPSNISCSHVLTITAGDLQLEAVRVEILDADLTSSEAQAYRQALVVLEASGQCPELDEGAASCRVCDVPLPPGTAGNHSDTCAGCRGTTPTGSD